MRANLIKKRASLFQCVSLFRIQRLGDDRFRIIVVRMRSSTNDEAEEETTQDVCRDEVNISFS